MTGNTVTETRSDGTMVKATINGNTTTGEESNWVSWKEVISGNTRTFTTGGTELYREVVDGNTITKTSPDGWFKIVVERQGYNIFITVTDKSYKKWNTDTFGYRTISEKDRIQHVIDVVTSGRMTHEDLFGQIFSKTYGR